VCLSARCAGSGTVLKSATMTKFQPKSLRAQLLRQILVPLLVILVVGSLMTFAIARHISNLVHDQWQLDSAMTIAQQLKAKEGHVALDLPVSAMEMFHWDRLDRIFLEVTAESQGVISRNATFPSLPGEKPAPGEHFYYDAIIDGQNVRVVALALTMTGLPTVVAQVQVAETLRKRQEITGMIILFLAPLQIAIQLLASIFTWSAVTHNLRQVDDIAGRLVGYDLDKLLPISDAESGPLEIKPLVAALNGLIHKLDESQSNQRRFIANAAHQMRTPLAALQVQTQRALRERDPFKHSEALKDALTAVTRLRHVVQQILTLARSEPTAQGMLAMMPLDLAAVARGEVERWTDQAVEHGIDLGYEGPDGTVMINGESSLLRELIGNLLDNAIRYTFHGGTVTLTISPSPLRLSIEDNGPGIPENEQHRVFERFYRLSSSTNDGCGLGLSIAKEIAARHGALVTLRTTAGGHGTTAEIIFDTPTAISCHAEVVGL
jgi:two-component system sensor histidine kinase TctE